MKSRIAAATLGLLLSAACTIVLAEAAPMYDIVIRNGRLLDGDGNPWVNADVAIKDGRFVKIGRVEGQGAREIDARGDYVSPGWIDMMDQSGNVLLKNGLAENKLREGVTSAIAGEGGTPVPSAQIADYFKKLEAQGISLNFGTYYSSGQARVEVMGDVAGRPTAQQMDAMKVHVDEAMRAGTMGIATALIYPPDSFQSTEDLIELARVAAKHGGIYASHMRDESAKLLQASATPWIDAIGLPHPRAYANFPRVIAEYVKKRHVLTLEDAIRKMTSWPATRMRLYDRGVIREGLKADVTIFNEERLDDVANYENPTAYPTGIDYVLVNGQLVIDQGRHTGAKPGKVLLGAGYDPAAARQSQ
jgi:N-acyl-D-aspartate/D-glutamate deacylase